MQAADVEAIKSRVGFAIAHAKKIDEEKAAIDIFVSEALMACRGDPVLEGYFRDLRGIGTNLSILRRIYSLLDEHSKGRPGGTMAESGYMDPLKAAARACLAARPQDV